MGRPIHTHLCGRPLAPYNRCTLGRETGLQKCIWQDDWLYLIDGSPVPAVEVTPPVPTERKPQPERIEYHFDQPILPPDFHGCARQSQSGFSRITARLGYLRLFGRESIGAWFEQALLRDGRSITVFGQRLALNFAPET